MVIIIGNGYGYSSSILDEAVGILHNINTLEKGMNPTTFPPAMGNSRVDYTL